MDDSIHFLNLVLEVFFLDLLLSGDNAVVIALACRGLAPGQRRQAVMLGTAGAIVLRVLLTVLGSLLLRIPLLKLLGGLALLVIAIQLALGEDNVQGEEGAGVADPAAGLMAAVRTVVVADFVMSTDNVVALAAVAKGNVAVLVLGLLFSVPLLMFGSLYVATLLQKYPVLVMMGVVLLGWLAGAIAIGDPLYADWVHQQSPALSYVVPLAVAIFVLIESRLIEENWPAAQRLRPRPRSQAAPSEAVAALRPAMVVTDVRLAPTEMSAAEPQTVAQGGLDEVSLVVDVPELTAQGTQAARPLWPVLLAAGTGITAFVTFAVLHFMPPPAAQPPRFDCQSGDIAVFYRHGLQQFRLLAGGQEAHGLVSFDNQIDWGDYHAVSTTLGFAPPTRVDYLDPHTLSLNGGMFDHVSCKGH